MLLLIVGEQRKIKVKSKWILSFRPWAKKLTCRIYFPALGRNDGQKWMNDRREDFELFLFMDSQVNSYGFWFIHIWASVIIDNVLCKQYKSYEIVLTSLLTFFNTYFNFTCVFLSVNRIHFNSYSFIIRIVLFSYKGTYFSVGCEPSWENEWLKQSENFKEKKTKLQVKSKSSSFIASIKFK